MNDQLTNTITAAEPSLGGPFEADYHRAVGGLRRALRDLLVGAGGDPSRPQSVARGFGLDKNLAWKVSRLVEADDDVEALRFLPGPAGRRMLCEAIGARASSEARDEVEAALSLFDRMVVLHAGDRATLDVLAQCLDPDHAQQEVLQQARKQAFLGNRATWGAQAATQLVAMAVAPGRGEVGSTESLHVGGLLGFRRIRANLRWRLLDRPALAADHLPALEPLVPPPPNAAGAPLLPDFCTRPTPSIGVVQRGDDVRYMIEQGQVGLVGELDCVYALKAHHPRQGPASEPTLRVPLTTPVEDLELALLIHRDLAGAAEPRVGLEGLLDGGGTDLDPLVPNCLDSTPKVVADVETPNAPRFGELLEAAVRTAGWDPAEFEVWRYSLPFPPIPSVAVFVTQPG